MNFPNTPIKFLDIVVAKHKGWLNKQPLRGESIRYMREAVDVQGQGTRFLEHYVFNPKSTGEDDDPALLQIYEKWRSDNEMRPIEAWDGTRLRPWLPPENNPKVPVELQGDLSHFQDAYVRWGGIMGRGVEWEKIDALGNAIESYFTEIRRHHTWSRPIGGGLLRLYRHNELNNIETAPYSIRFWGFLKWADQLRKRLLGEPIEEYPHDRWSDITFMDEFNQNHFPWHDDVFGNGKCPNWENEFGEKARHKYNMNTYGYGLEFLQYHSDLLKTYNDWLARFDREPTSTWREGKEPWDPGIHHAAYILKQAGWGAWGLGGTNGEALDPHIYVPDLVDDPNLSKFDSASELGAYLELHGVGFHGAGHVEHCDIRDPYTNNYSLRFFHWHQWIDVYFKHLLSQGKPKHFWDDPDRRLDSPVEEGFMNRFKPVPDLEFPFEGKWTYRSYNIIAEIDPDNPGSLWFYADLTLEVPKDNNGRPIRDNMNHVVFNGELQGTSPEYHYTIEGYIDQRNVRYDITPDWWDERSILVMTAIGDTDGVRDHRYEYRAHLIPDWPDGKDQVPAFVGTVLRANRPDDRSLEGKVGTFIAMKYQD